MQFIFPLSTFLAAKENGTLCQWTIDYLKGEGNNDKCAEAIENHPDYTAKLIECDLDKLIRVTGPESTMTFREDKKIWNERINYFVNLLKQGIELPPLIVTNFWHENHINDGTHRFEALKQLGYKKYWTIVFTKP